MEELVKVGTKELPVIEWNGQRVITTAQLADIYETDVDNVKKNFQRNGDKFTEGEHFYLLTGEELRTFKNMVTDCPLVGKNANQLYLWTRRGASRHCKMLGTDKAWEQFDVLEENYYNPKAQLDMSKLSPDLQMFQKLFNSVAEQQLEQKRQAEKVNQIEQTVSNMKDIFTKPIGDWKSEINGRIREISVKSGIGYQTLYGQLYGELETTAHCSLNMLQRNKINKMKKAGNNETAIKNGTTKIQIIYEKPQLKAIFEGIVKNYAMRYCS